MLHESRCLPYFSSCLKKKFTAILGPICSSVLFSMSSMFLALLRFLAIRISALFRTMSSLVAIVWSANFSSSISWVKVIWLSFILSVCSREVATTHAKKKKKKKLDIGDFVLRSSLKTFFNDFLNISYHFLDSKSSLVIFTDKRLFKARESYVLHIFLRMNLPLSSLIIEGWSPWRSPIPSNSGVFRWSLITPLHFVDLW